MKVRFANLSKPGELLIQVPSQPGKARTTLPQISILVQPGVVGDRSVIPLRQEVNPNAIQGEKRRERYALQEVLYLLRHGRKVASLVLSCQCCDLPYIRRHYIKNRRLSAVFLDLGCPLYVSPPV